MAAQIPTYVLSPNWNIPPDGPGSLKIGSILLAPKNPQAILNEDEVLPTPANTISVHQSHNWSAKNENLVSLRADIWTSFLAPLLGVGLDMDGKLKRSRHEEYACERLETIYFPPGKAFSDYAQEALRNEDVKGYLQRSLRRSVYMVVGLKIARGAKVMIAVTGRGIGVETKIGVDGSQNGIPVSGGPITSWEREKRWTEALGSCDDFVIAYRLVRITIKLDGSFTRKDYNRGAMMDDDDKAAEPEYQTNEWAEEDGEWVDSSLAVHAGDGLCKLVSV